MSETALLIIFGGLLIVALGIGAIFHKKSLDKYTTKRIDR